MSDQKTDQDTLDELKKSGIDLGGDSEFDPLELQADALPAYLKGSEGNQPHVFDADGGAILGSDSLDENLDEDFDLDRVNPADLTAD